MNCVHRRNSHFGTNKVTNREIYFQHFGIQFFPDSLLFTVFAAHTFHQQNCHHHHHPPHQESANQQGRWRFVLKQLGGFIGGLVGRKEGTT